MLTVSDRIQIPSKTTRKDTGTKVNEHYYFISKYSLNTSNFFLLANTAFGLPVVTRDNNLLISSLRSIFILLGY